MSTVSYVTPRSLSQMLRSLAPSLPSGLMAVPPLGLSEDTQPSEHDFMRDSAIFVATRAFFGADTTLRVQGRPPSKWLDSRFSPTDMDVVGRRGVSTILCVTQRPMTQNTAFFGAISPFGLLPPPKPGPNHAHEKTKKKSVLSRRIKVHTSIQTVALRA